MTILGDDLYRRQPFCQTLKDKHIHFILVCKPDSHTNLYETIKFLSIQGLLGRKVVRKWNGRYADISALPSFPLLPVGRPTFSY